MEKGDRRNVIDFVRDKTEGEKTKRIEECQRKGGRKKGEGWWCGDKILTSDGQKKSPGERKTNCFTYRIPYALFEKAKWRGEN